MKIRLNKTAIRTALLGAFNSTSYESPPSASLVKSLFLLNYALASVGSMVSTVYATTQVPQVFTLAVLAAAGNPEDPRYHIARRLLAKLNLLEVADLAEVAVTLNVPVPAPSDERQHAVA